MISPIRYTGLFKCETSYPCKGCKWLKEYDDTFSVQSRDIHLGWCKLCHDDPDSGYIIQDKVPPCVVWRYEKVK